MSGGPLSFEEWKQKRNLNIATSQTFVQLFMERMSANMLKVLLSDKTRSSSGSKCQMLNRYGGPPRFWLELQNYCLHEHDAWLRDRYDGKLVLMTDSEFHRGRETWNSVQPDVEYTPPVLS